MGNPKVTFHVNREFDIWKINEFLNKEWRRDYFRERIFGAHPDLKIVIDLSKKEREKEITKYVNKLYGSLGNVLIKRTKRMQKDWNKISESFFKITNNIFRNTPWPEGEYKAILSVSPPYPRLLDRKIFQVDLGNDNNWKVITAHEMNHFIFFEYVRKKYLPKFKKTTEKEMNKKLHNKFKIPLWDLSEVHDVILLNSEEYQKLFPIKTKPYLEHRGYYKECLRIWKDVDADIDKFFEKIEK